MRTFPKLQGVQKMETLKPVETIDAAEEWRRLMDVHASMSAMLEEAEARLTRAAPAVSAWSAAAHLYHVATANFGIARMLPRLLDGSLAASESPRNAEGIAMVLGGLLPHGARAPQGLTPPDELDRATVAKRLAGARRAVGHLEPLLGVIASAGIAFDHPYLGPLTPAEWLRFMNVHTVHHLRTCARVLAQG